MKLLFSRASPRLFTQTGFDAILKKLKVHFSDLKTYPSEMAFENVALFLTCCLLNLFATPSLRSLVTLKDSSSFQPVAFLTYLQQLKPSNKQG